MVGHLSLIEGGGWALGGPAIVPRSRGIPRGPLQRAAAARMDTHRDTALTSHPATSPTSHGKQPQGGTEYVSHQPLLVQLGADDT